MLPKFSFLPCDVTLLSRAFPFLLFLSWERDIKDILLTSIIKIRVCDINDMEWINCLHSKIIK